MKFPTFSCCPTFSIKQSRDQALDETQVKKKRMLPVIGLASFSPARAWEWFIFPLGIWGSATLCTIQNEPKVHLGDPGCIRTYPGLLFFTSPSTPVLALQEGIKKMPGRAGAQAELCTSQHRSMGKAPEIPFFHWALIASGSKGVQAHIY